jgi:hypothetical protein
VLQQGAPLLSPRLDLLQQVGRNLAAEVRIHINNWLLIIWLLYGYYMVVICYYMVNDG